MKSPKLIVLLPIVCLVTSPVHADIIDYSLPMFPGFEDGWSIESGQITTDGTLGPIGIENILEWTIEFRSPAGEYELSSEFDRLLTVNSPELFLVADPDRLVLQPTMSSGSLSGTRIDFRDGRPDLNVSVIISGPTLNFAGAVTLIDGLANQIPGANTSPEINNLRSADPSVYLVNSPLTVARAVPEPTAFSSLLALSLLFVVRRSPR